MSKIIRARDEQAEAVSYLFDRYRQFYGEPSDPDLARRFIESRIENNESVIFIALSEDGGAQGFVQLYESFCSVAACRILILYDLYVDEDSRGKGVGEALMNRATEFGRETEASRIDLLTGVTNKPGQALYQKLGYYRANLDFYAYSLDLEP